MNKLIILSFVLLCLAGVCLNKALPQCPINKKQLNTSQQKELASCIKTQIMNEFRSYLQKNANLKNCVVAAQKNKQNLKACIKSISKSQKLSIKLRARKACIPKFCKSKRSFLSQETDQIYFQSGEQACRYWAFTSYLSTNPKSKPCYQKAIREKKKPDGCIRFVPNTNEMNKYINDFCKIYTKKKLQLTQFQSVKYQQCMYKLQIQEAQKNPKAWKCVQDNRVNIDKVNQCFNLIPNLAQIKKNLDKTCSKIFVQVSSQYQTLFKVVPSKAKKQCYKNNIKLAIQQVPHLWKCVKAAKNNKNELNKCRKLVTKADKKTVKKFLNAVCKNAKI